MIAAARERAVAATVGSSRLEAGAPLAVPVTAGIAAGSAVALAPLRIAAAGVAVLTVALVAARWQPRAVASGLVGIAVLTIALTGVRPAAWMTVSDAFLLAGGFVLVAAASRDDFARVIRELRLPLVGAGLILSGGMLGAAFSSSLAASLTTLVKFEIAAVGLLVVLRLWRPSAPELSLVLWLWIVSASISALAALGPELQSFGRPAGLADHPNHLAIVSLLASGPALALATRTRGAVRALALLCCGALALGVVLSGSRAGLLGLAIVVLLAVVLFNRRRVVLGLAVAALALSGLGAVGAVDLPSGTAVTRLVSGDANVRLSNRERRAQLEASLDRVRRHPLTGEGFAYATEGHDIYLQLWASAGLLGLAGFALVAGSALAPLARRPLARQRAHADAVLLVGVGVAFGGYLVAGLFQNVLWDRNVWLAVGLLACFQNVGPPARGALSDLGDVLKRLRERRP